MEKITDKFVRFTDFLFGFKNIPFKKSSPKITQREFDGFPVIEGYRIFPSGDYTEIKYFGNYCRFSDHCIFSCNSIFGDNCCFGLDCIFGPYCRFGESCSFGDNCTAMAHCEFKALFHCGMSCIFGLGCVFGKRSRFKDLCVFGDGCTFKDFCILGNRCVAKSRCHFGDGCDLAKCLLEKGCEFECGCSFWDCSFTYSCPTFGQYSKFFGTTTINYVPVKRITVVHALYKDYKHVIVGIDENDTPIVFHEDFQGNVQSFKEQTKSSFYKAVVPEIAKALLVEYNKKEK